MWKSHVKQLAKIAPSQLLPTQTIQALLFSTSRSATTSSPDKILLRGLLFHGYHGVLPEEQSLGQKFIIDAELHTSLKHAGTTDNLEHTTNYAAVYKDIKNIVEGKPYQLIETVAEKIAQHILKHYTSVESVQVAVKKPHVAIAGVVDSLGIEIYRSR